MTVGHKELSREPSDPPGLFCIPSGPGLHCKCFTCQPAAGVPVPHLPAYIKEIPHFGELHHANASFSEWLRVPAGFSFPQPTVTLLHVLHAVSGCACCCGWALVQVTPAWVQSRWETEGISVPRPELTLSLQAHTQVRVTLFSALSSSRLCSGRCMWGLAALFWVQVIITEGDLLPLPSHERCLYFGAVTG